VILKVENVNGVIYGRFRKFSQKKKGVPDDDAIEGDGVPAGVHQAEPDVVVAHEHGQGVVAGDADGERRVPPRRVGEAVFLYYFLNKPAFSQSVMLVKNFFNI